MTAELGPFFAHRDLIVLAVWEHPSSEAFVLSGVLSVRVILLNYRPTVFALKQKAC